MDDLEGLKRYRALRIANADPAEALDKKIDLRMVYTSNAIEGNPLSAAETNKIIEEGLAIGDVSLQFNNEAADLYRAVKEVRRLSLTSEIITEGHVVGLHRTILWGSAPELCGKYSENGRRINGVDKDGNSVPIVFPNREKARRKLTDLYEWLDGTRLGGTQNTPAVAFRMHRELVAIHPFEDGNGRTSRLVMNLFLLRGDYPPVIIAPEHREEYTRAMQRVVVDKDCSMHDKFMSDRLAESVAQSVAHLEQPAHKNQTHRPAARLAKPG